MPFTKETARAAALKAQEKRQQQSTDPSEQDARLVRSAAPDVRGDRDGASLASRDEAVESLSDAELDALVQSEYEQTALPNAPLIPGFHLCWLTTMSKYDTPAKRERLGYRPVRYSEVPGFDPSNGATVAEPNGVVTCNEMVLYKIPEARYQAIMRYFHHKRPADEEESIVNKAKATAGKDGKGKTLLQDGDEEEGGTLQHLEESVARARRVNPTFS